MLWFHRLQQRLSLTRNEAVTLIVLCALFLGGLLARHVQQQMNPIAPNAYAETDRDFIERSTRALGDAGAVEPDSDGPPAERSPPADTSESADVFSGPPNPPQPIRDAAGVASSESRETGSAAEGRIDLNRASFNELQQLPRIGPKTAERIVAFRETYGPFGHVDDLAQVRGIGPKTMEQLRPLIHVGQDSMGH